MCLRIAATFACEHIDDYIICDHATAPIVTHECGRHPQTADGHALPIPHVRIQNARCRDCGVALLDASVEEAMAEARWARDLAWAAWESAFSHDLAEYWTRVWNYYIQMTKWAAQKRHSFVTWHDWQMTLIVRARMPGPMPMSTPMPMPPMPPTLPMPPA
ncbi:MAG: hypothetical protein M1826_001952 [Phylliscum demangeonii]|nr:MAG: hypothetical protein M1826_001952 [Phylliscum demangeonii]